MVFVFIEILFKILLFKGGVLIYAEHCISALLSKRETSCKVAMFSWQTIVHGHGGNNLSKQLRSKEVESYRSRPRSYFISMSVFIWRGSALMDYRLEKRDAHLALMSNLYDSPYSSAPLIPTFLLALIRFNVFNGTYANDSVFILFPLIK